MSEEKDFSAAADLWAEEHDEKRDGRHLSFSDWLDNLGSRHRGHGHTPKPRHGSEEGDTPSSPARERAEARAYPGSGRRSSTCPDGPRRSPEYRPHLF